MSIEASARSLCSLRSTHGKAFTASQDADFLTGLPDDDVALRGVLRRVDRPGPMRFWFFGSLALLVLLCGLFGLLGADGADGAEQFSMPGFGQRSAATINEPRLF